jgi:formylglycine-generating enzyme required for sulfatase activity
MALLSTTVFALLWLAQTTLAGQGGVASLTSRSAQPLSRDEQRTLRRGDIFKECEQCPEMIVVPSGKFTMGSPTSEAGHRDIEGPQHSVTISRPFAVGRFAVTADEWFACKDDDACNDLDRPSWWRESMEGKPVVYVAWHEAKRYVAWLSRKTGKPHRLLSEAEREYVTRAGATTPFWGRVDLTQRRQLRK